eukprot:1152316-Pelagomonas_calceolata.AAC.1
MKRGGSAPFISKVVNIWESYREKGGLQSKEVGLQPETLADRMLKSIDFEISQNVEARQERNKVSIWKLGK